MCGIECRMSKNVDNKGKKIADGDDYVKTKQ